MIYNGLSFIYDNVPSETYGLLLMSTDGGNGTGDGTNGINIITEDLPRRAKPYFFGTESKGVLEIDLVFSSSVNLDRYKIAQIQKWLMNRKEYKKLKIIQEDMMGITYNCIITNSKIITFGNYPYSFKCTAICDSGYGWENERTYPYTITTSPQNITHINRSDIDDYLYPILEFTTNSVNATVSIINTDDNNREIKFTGLSNGEVITVDNNYGFIESSLGISRFDKFNDNFFRLIPNINKLIVSGNVSNIKIKYQNAKKVGA